MTESVLLSRVLCFFFFLSFFIIGARAQPSGEGIRRAARWRGLLEMYREKPAIPRSVTYRSYTAGDGTEVGEVAVDGRMVFRFTAPAGDFSASQRAEIVYRRLERLVELRGVYEPVRAEKRDGQWVVTLGGCLVATAATGKSLHYRMSRRKLAERWADKLRTTLNNVLGPGGQVLRGNPPVVKLKVTLPPFDDRYKYMVKGNKAFRRSDFVAALRWYKEALKEDPSAFDAHFRLGRSFEKLDRFNEARDEYVAVLQLRPGYYPARMALAKLDKRLHGSPKQEKGKEEKIGKEKGIEEREERAEKAGRS